MNIRTVTRLMAGATLALVPWIVGTASAQQRTQPGVTSGPAAQPTDPSQVPGNSSGGGTKGTSAQAGTQGGPAPTGSSAPDSKGLGASAPGKTAH
jgi:hypothetical protein